MLLPAVSLTRSPDVDRVVVPFLAKSPESHSTQAPGGFAMTIHRRCKGKSEGTSPCAVILSNPLSLGRTRLTTGSHGAAGRPVIFDTVPGRVRLRPSRLDA